MELATNGTNIVVLDRRPNPQPIVERRELSASQIEWCINRWECFGDRRRVVRLSEGRR